MENPNWKELVSNIGLSEVNAELDKRFESTFKTLRDIASVCTTDNSLIERVIALKPDWLPTRDQYERSCFNEWQYSTCSWAYLLWLSCEH